jgi:hypothetical protein
MAVQINAKLSLLRSVRRDVIPDGRVVVMAARIVSSSPLVRDNLELTAADRLSLRALDRASPVRKTGACPAPLFPLGGHLQATDQCNPGILEIATWNTGEPITLNVTGSLSHAERQFIGYLNKKAEQEPLFLASIRSIEIDINLSPCTACADSLSGLLRNINDALGPESPKASPVTRTVLPGTSSSGGRRILVSGAPSEAAPHVHALLRWGKLYTSGPQATNWPALFELCKAGWQLQSPPGERPTDTSIQSTMVPVDNL